MYKKRTLYRNGNSRSANAENAESEGRYPLTRCGKELGVPLNMFKEAIEHIEYRTNEWHHVGKYANKVNYYDSIEIGENYRFWLFCSKKSKKYKVEFKKKASKLAFNELLVKLIPTNLKAENTFEKAIKLRCEQLHIPFTALFKVLPKDESLQNYNKAYRLKTRVVKNGTYEHEDIIINHNGSTYSNGVYTVSNCKHILPFDLTEKNLRGFFKKNIEQSIKRKLRYQNEYNWILDKYWLLNGINNLKNGTGFTNHNSGVGISDLNHKIKNRIINKLGSIK